jgi:hypothetical protein
MNNIQDEIKNLIDEYLTLNASEENRRRLACWEPEICARDQWHGRAIEGAFAKEGLIPITIDIQNPLWLEVFPQDLSQTYTSPEGYLRFYLQKRVTQFKEFKDDTPLEPIIPIWLHTAFEMALFGMPYHYYPDKDPLADLSGTVCHDLNDLESMPMIDFNHSGMMPVGHKIFEGIQEIVGNSFQVLFPEWTRGPFGVALHLAGYQNLLMAMIQNPEFVHAIMQRITDERKNYFISRGKLTGESVIPPGSLFNDDVDANIIGPKHYHDFIKPYEEDLAVFHGRISYWHSCGNTAIFMKELLSIDRIDVLDISGFTDPAQVIPEVSPRSPRLDIRLHPLEDLQDATPEQMEAKLTQVIELCRNSDLKSLSIRVSGLNPWKSAKEDFEQIRRWIAIARRVIDRN